MVSKNSKISVPVGGRRGRSIQSCGVFKASTLIGSLFQGKTLNRLSLFSDYFCVPIQSEEDSINVTIEFFLCQFSGKLLIHVL